MLWLAGIMGVMVVGAVTLVDFSDDTSDEDDDVVGFDDFIDENGHGDLSQTLQDLNAVPPDQTPPLPAIFGDAALGDWVTADNPTDVGEFDTAEDDLVLVWDDTLQDGEPIVTLAVNPDDSDVTDIMMDDMIVAHVASDAGLTSENIALIPMSAAEIMGWEDSEPSTSDAGSIPA